MNKLDFLLVEPSLNWEETLRIKNLMKSGKSDSLQVGLKISTAYLVTAVKDKGFKVKFIDMLADMVSVDDLVKYIKNNKPKVIGMPAFTFQVPVAVELFSIIKKSFPDITTCLGGVHSSAMPEETLADYQDIDFVVKGEAETTMPIVLERIIGSQSISNIPGIFTRDMGNYNIFEEDINNLSFPDWGEFQIVRQSVLRKKKMILPVLTGRGCPFRCLFCCRQSGGVCRRRTVEAVIEEVERNVKLYNCNVISFMDETFILNKEWIYKFMEAMKSTGLNKKVKWNCATRVNSVSLGLLKDMKEAGCYEMSYGLESGNNEVLKIIQKGCTAEKMVEVVAWTRKAGIAPSGPMMIGLPGDTKETIWESIKFGEKLNLFSLTFPILVPYPGTEIRKMALAGEYGMRIRSNDWGEYLANDLHRYGRGIIGHLESKDLSWEERIEIQKEAYKRNPKKNLLEYIKSIN